LFDVAHAGKSKVEEAPWVMVFVPVYQFAINLKLNNKKNNMTCLFIHHGDIAVASRVGRRTCGVEWIKPYDDISTNKMREKEVPGLR